MCPEPSELPVPAADRQTPEGLGSRVLPSTCLQHQDLSSEMPQTAIRCSCGAQTGAHSVVRTSWVPRLAWHLCSRGLTLNAAPGPAGGSAGHRDTPATCTSLCTFGIAGVCPGSDLQLHLVGMQAGSLSSSFDMFAHHLGSAVLHSSARSKESIWPQSNSSEARTRSAAIE